MIIKLISGGQTGADQAGLLAAQSLDIVTGGWACKGWLTEDGPAPWLADYGLKEFHLPGYDNRTIANIRDSDGTVIFGSIAHPGSRLTFNTCSNYRPCVCFHIERGEVEFKKARQYFRDWIERDKIKVLNVAGNRESVNPGIGEVVVNFLLDTLK